jgi:hypothetical protein
VILPLAQTAKETQIMAPAAISLKFIFGLSIADFGLTDCGNDIHPMVKDKKTMHYLYIRQPTPQKVNSTICLKMLRPS